MLSHPRRWTLWVSTSFNTFNTSFFWIFFWQQKTLEIEDTKHFSTRVDSASLFFSSSTVWPMTFSEPHLWIPPPTETFEVPKIQWNFYLFFLNRRFLPKTLHVTKLFPANLGYCFSTFFAFWLGGPFTHFWPHRSGFDTGANTTVAEIGTRICGGSLDMIHLFGDS